MASLSKKMTVLFALPLVWGSVGAGEDMKNTQKAGECSKSVF